MGISTESYKAIIRQGRKLAPGFVYKSNVPREHWPAMATYEPDMDIIKFHSPSFYKSKSEFASVMFHELAHWAMCVNRDGQVKKSSSLISGLVEEIIAEMVSVKLSKKFGYSKVRRSIGYITEYKNILRRMTDRTYYQDLVKYSKFKSEKVVRYLLNTDK